MKYDLFIQAAKAGASDLRRHCDLLDAINVFPVVDGDTGANMAGTLAPLFEQDLSPDDISQAIVVGARGNSGIILAQFVVGFLDQLRGREDISLKLVTQAVSEGRKQAYGAVSEPVEGTMLTTMTKLEELLTGHTGNFDLSDHAALELALAGSVAETQQQMNRLREAGVVDSGALGFHIFACGLTLGIAAFENMDDGTKHVRAREDGDTLAPLGEIATKIDPAFLKSVANTIAALRYCVDVVVEIEKEPPENWQTQFKSIGGSIDFARRGDLLKLHVHTNNEQDVRRLATKLGKIVHFLAEDMAEGLVRVASTNDSATKNKSVRILGDSSMSLSCELIEEFGIERLDAYINVYGKMVRDRDLNLNSLFAGMRNGTVFRTAQPSAKEAEIFVETATGNSDFALYIGVGTAYTGIQNLIRNAAAQIGSPHGFSIVDTRAASGQQGVVTLATALKAEQTQNPEELNSYAKNQAETAREYLVIDDLKYLSRTGRIGKIKAKMAGLLSVKPIVGHGESGAITYAKTKSNEAALKEITDRVVAHPGTTNMIVLLEYTDNRQWLETVRKELETALPASTVFYESPLSSTSAVHMGPGTWGVAVTRI